MEAHNAGLTEESFESAVRRVADVLIQNGIWLQGCGCCGSIETDTCIFDSFSVTADSLRRWTVTASARILDARGEHQRTFNLTYMV